MTFSDADISLIALQGIEEKSFDDVVGGLETTLPDVFALHAVLPPPPTDAEVVIPEFVATLSPEARMVGASGVRLEPKSTRRA